MFFKQLTTAGKRPQSETVYFSLNKAQAAVCVRVCACPECITFSQHSLFLHTNTSLTYMEIECENKALSLVTAACTHLVCTCVCVCACLGCVCCTRARCVHPDSVFWGNFGFDVLRCRQLLIPLLAFTALTQAKLAPVPQKSSLFQRHVERDTNELHPSSARGRRHKQTRRHILI